MTSVQPSNADIGETTQGSSVPTQATASTENPSATIQKIQELLKNKNDTSRFVGLALLKSVLDNSPQLREDEDAITTLWKSVSPKFLDRLLRSGSKQGSSSKDARDMIDIAVAVLHTFTALLPDVARTESSLVGRIPTLVSVILHSSDTTTQLILQTMLSLVSHEAGAKEFAAIEDISPLTEIAPSQPLVLNILLFSWVNSASVSEDKLSLPSKIDKTIQVLVASFKGTDAVTLLEFLGQLLRRLDPESIPNNPSWMKTVIGFIRNLVTSKPTAAGRAAYTNLAASLLQACPTEAPQLLFSDETKSEKPFSFILVNLLLVDIRSSIPTLLEQLNSPEYETISRRLASAFDVVSSFVGFLIRYLEEDDPGNPLPSSVMAPNLLLKLRKEISETMFVTIEYLRDRWDASVAGALGLHPDARIGTADTFSGSRLTLAWDSKTDNANQDPLILAAVRALAIWLREDDNDTLRKEAAGLSDMFMDLYKGSTTGRLDFRRPILVALEGTTAVEEGVESLLEHDGWHILTNDMLAVLQASSSINDEIEAARGIEIVRILLPIVEKEHPGSREAWMAVITVAAAWDVPDTKQTALVHEFQVAVLQLVTALLSNTHPGMQRRYVHSTSAVLGIVQQLESNVQGDPALMELLEDVENTLGDLR